MPEHTADAACPHDRIERREKFDGTPYWVCLDCGEDWWEGPPRVAPSGQTAPDGKVR